MKKLLFTLFALILMLCAAAIAEEAQAPALLLEEPEVFTPEWFMGENPEPVPGEPCLSFTVNTYTEDGENDRGPVTFMMWEVYAYETAGLPFTLTRMDTYGYFWEEDDRYEYESFNGSVIWYDYEGETPHWETAGRMPVQFCRGYGYIFYGMDADGNELSFRLWVDLSSFME